VKILTKLLILLCLYTTVYSKEWVIKVSLFQVKTYSSNKLRNPEWFAKTFKIKNMVNLSYFDSTFIPPYKDSSVTNPNNKFYWPFISIDTIKSNNFTDSLTIINFNVSGKTTPNIPNIKSKYIFAGTPVLLKDGVEQTINKTKFTMAKRPRTVIGSHHKDSLFIYISTGIRVVDMPKRLKELGCRDAINFDGGGSTFLYIDYNYIYKQKKIRLYPNILTW
jgi:exopolysaccharide biosynthesis protein